MTLWPETPLTSQVNASAEAYTARTIQALGVLLNNDDALLTPPVPHVTFRPAQDAQSLVYVGPVSAAQYDRLNYLTHLAGLDVRMTPSHDYSGACAFRVEVRNGDTETLENLAAQEPQRRAKAGEAERLLQRTTGLDWCWDGLC